MTGTGITCLVVDDHPAILRAVTATLAAAEIEVVATADTVRAALAALAAHRPDVAIVDPGMPAGGGLELVRSIEELSPATTFVVFTGAPDPDRARRILGGPVTGYVSKDSRLDDLVEAVRHAATGSTWVDGQTAAALLGAGPARPELTAREVDVLGCLADGLTQVEAARSLHIAPETVRVHVQKARRKLDAASATQAVVQAVRLHLLD